MSIRSLCVAIFFSLFLLLSLGIFFKPAIAQVCPASRVIDLYYCDSTPISPGVCASIKRDPEYTSIAVDCSLQGNECKTVGGNCSSIDTCEYNSQFDKCFCTFSEADCNVTGGGGGGGGGCTTTAPTVSSVQWGVNNVTINFNGGTGGNRNDIAFGSNKANVATKCFSSVGCTTMLNVTSPLVIDRSDYFNNGTVYYFKVWNMAGTCTKSSGVKQDISSCEISPNTFAPKIGDPSSTLTSEVVSTWVFVSSPTEVKVTFSSDDTGVASVNPSSETNSYRYQTSVSPVGVGSTSLRSNVYLDNVLSCTATESSIEVSNPLVGSPWWQVIDGDITTNQGISSSVFTGEVFDDDGVGGFPGVPVYGTSLDVGDGTTSRTNWNADTATTQPRTFDYLYFEKLVPDDVILNDISLLSAGGAIKSHGYEWYKVTGNLSIDSLLNLTTRKVILFVSGNLNINNEIWVADGRGFFGTFVGGNINVGGTVTRVNVPSLEGIYLTDGVFNTGIGTGKLFIRGSIATLDGINLQRDLADDTNPAEVFKYAPDQVTLFPKELSFKRTKWAEVSP